MVYGLELLIHDAHVGFNPQALQIRTESLLAIGQPNRFTTTLSEKQMQILSVLAGKSSLARGLYRSWSPIAFVKEWLPVGHNPTSALGMLKSSSSCHEDE